MLRDGRDGRIGVVGLTNLLVLVDGGGSKRCKGRADQRAESHVANEYLPATVSGSSAEGNSTGLDIKIYKPSITLSASLDYQSTSRPEPHFEAILPDEVVDLDRHSLGECWRWELTWR